MSSQRWSASKYPYQTDYNDHFETPVEAYKDIKCLLMWFMGGSTDGRVYDPYYCHGQSKKLLESLGFTGVIHKKRDFYEDIRLKQVPEHDIFLTNPPFSDDHKARCLEFAFRQQREKNIPFFILMPCYVASKQYYRELLGQSEDDVLYVYPRRAYNYEHPEGTGNDYAPFESMWFCGVGKNCKDECEATWSTQQPKNNSTSSLATSINDLRAAGVIASRNRPSSRKRRRQKQKYLEGLGDASASTAPRGTTDSSRADRDMRKPDSRDRKKIKKSKYRDENGSRTKKRF